MHQSAWWHRLEKLQQFGHEGLQRFDSVRGCNKNDDGDGQGGQILLRTSCPDSNVANGRGNDSSSRTRTGRQHLLGGDFEYSHRLLALHRREVVKELVEGIYCRQIVDKVP